MTFRELSLLRTSLFTLAVLAGNPCLAQQTADNDRPDSDLRADQKVPYFSQKGLVLIDLYRKLFLEDSPSYRGAADIVYKYGTVDLESRPLQYLLPNVMKLPEFRAKVKEGRRYQQQYWHDLATRVTGPEGAKLGLQFDPYAETISSLRDLQSGKRLQLRPYTEAEAVRMARTDIQRKYHLSEATFGRWIADPTNRRDYQKLVWRYQNQDIPDTQKPSFKAWQGQELERLDNFILGNYRKTLELLISECGMKVGLSEPGKPKDAWQDDDAKPFTVLLERDAIAKLHLKLVREKDGSLAVQARLAGRQLDLTIRSTVRTKYLGHDVHYMGAEYVKLRPTLPLGLMQEIHGNPGRRNESREFIASAAKLAAEATKDVEKIRNLVIETAEKGIPGLIDAAIKGQEERTKDVFSPDLNKFRDRFGTRWFGRGNTSFASVVDLMWAGYAKDKDFWIKRDLQAELNGAPDFTEGTAPLLKNLEPAPRKKVLNFGKGLLRSVKGTIATEGEDADSLVKNIDWGSGGDEHDIKSPESVKRLEKEMIFEIKPSTTIAVELPSEFEIPPPISAMDATAAQLSQDKTHARPNQFFLMRRRPHPIGADRIMPILKPTGFELNDVEVFAKEGTKLEAGTDYELLYDAKRGHYFLNVKNKSIGTVRYIAGFREAPKAHLDSMSLPQKLLELDENRLRAIAGELKTAGLTAIAETLEKTLDEARSHGQKLSVFSLATIFEEEALYSYYPANKKHTFGPSRFGNYSKYVNSDGRLCAQCDGSNSLFRDFLRAYFADDPSLSAETQSYYVNAEKTLISLGMRHRKAVLTKNGKPLVVLDVTPPKLDPRKPEKRFSFAFLKEMFKKLWNRGKNKSKTEVVTAKQEVNTPKLKALLGESAAPMVIEDEIGVTLKQIEAAQKSMEDQMVLIVGNKHPKLDPSEPVARVSKLAAVLKQTLRGQLSFEQIRAELQKLMPEHSNRSATSVTATIDELVAQIRELGAREVERLESYSQKLQTIPKGENQKFGYYANNALRGRINDLLATISKSAPALQSVPNAAFTAKKTTLILPPEIESTALAAEQILREALRKRLCQPGGGGP